jgi:hypothetical protein
MTHSNILKAIFSSVAGNDTVSSVRGVGATRDMTRDILYDTLTFSQVCHFSKEGATSEEPTTRENVTFNSITLHQYFLD